MSQPLPIGEYKWLSHRKIAKNFNTSDELKNTSTILKLKEDSHFGYIFEVDLEYPASLHDIHDDFPFCPEKRGVPGITSNDKLMLTFYDKNNYVVHYSMLKLALEHGLKLKKVHRVLQFRQMAWLKPYIDLNTALRTQACSKFEKDFYKLLNNAIYGKTMENLRLRSDIRLVNKWDGRVGARRLIAMPNFKNCKLFDENLTSIELHKTHILMDKPIVVGMCVLDISKVLMYKFLYNYLKPKYGQNVRVAYTDTDSFILEVKTEDFYADIRDEPDIHEFDTFDYPLDNIYNIRRHNNKVIGKFKDEMNGKIIEALAGVRAKCYALLLYDENRGGKGKKLTKKMSKKIADANEIKRAKGVASNAIKNISFEKFYNCVINNCIQTCKQHSIRSKSHNVYTISMDKMALNPFDQKRLINKPECINTTSWGHYSIDSAKMQEECQCVLDNARRMKQFMLARVGKSA